MFEVPEAMASELVRFIDHGDVVGNVREALNRKQQEHAAVADLPLDELDEHYRAQLAGIYLWDDGARWELRPDRELEFPMR